MGMFAPEYKKTIPRFARRIGVVTAPTGAAVQDIRNIAARRNPYVQLILYPALVQGEGAAASIVNGIRALDAMGLDVLIVGRGGGSIEDLWAFNEEIVARAIFECNTPVISAVGHETDTTIADYVADMRAPTPSAAAELAVFDYRTVKEQITGLYRRLSGNMEQKIKFTGMQIRQMESRLHRLSPESRMREKRMYTAGLEQKIEQLMQKRLAEKRHEVAIFAERMERLSPLRKLSGGYAYVTDSKEKALLCVSQVDRGDEVTIQLLEGKIKAEVTEVIQ